jgi:hypothetical protein
MPYNQTKSYAETKRLTPVDWHTFLKLPLGKVTPSLMSKMVRKSEAWVSCACGNQCAIIPRRNNGRPLDEELAQFGGYFFSNIVTPQEAHQEDNVKAYNVRRKNARTTLRQVEQISKRLIKEINGQTSSL